MTHFICRLFSRYGSGSSVCKGHYNTLQLLSPFFSSRMCDLKTRQKVFFLGGGAVNAGESHRINLTGPTYSVLSHLCDKTL